MDSPSDWGGALVVPAASPAATALAAADSFGPRVRVRWGLAGEIFESNLSPKAYLKPYGLVLGGVTIFALLIAPDDLPVALLMFLVTSSFDMRKVVKRWRRARRFGRIPLLERVGPTPAPQVVRIAGTIEASQDAFPTPGSARPVVYAEHVP